MKLVNKTGYLKGTKTAKNPVNVIPSNLITTQGMAFPIKANGKTLYPNTGQYKFNTPYVVETPLKQEGANELVPDKMSKTKLSKTQEIAYQRWRKSKGYNESDDYDMRGFWKKHGFKNLGSPKEREHFTDEFKRLAPFSEGDGYPTLSDESNVASKFDKRRQGTWTKDDKYINYQDGSEELKASEAAKFTYRIKDKKRRDTQVRDMYNNTLDSFRGDTTGAKRHFKDFFTHYGSERFNDIRPLEGYYGFDRKDYDDKTLDSLGRNWHKQMRVPKKQNGTKSTKAKPEFGSPSYFKNLLGIDLFGNPGNPTPNKEYNKKLMQQYSDATKRGLSLQGLGDLALGLTGEAAGGAVVNGVLKGAKTLLKPITKYNLNTNSSRLLSVKDKLKNLLSNKTSPSSTTTTTKPQNTFRRTGSEDNEQLAKIISHKVNLPQSIDRDDLHALIKKQLDRVDSDEYISRRMATTGETKEQIASTVKEWKDHLTDATNYNSDWDGKAYGAYSNWRKKGYVSVNSDVTNKNPEKFLDIFEHEFLHGLSPALKNEKLYKNYPILNVTPKRSIVQKIKDQFNGKQRSIDYLNSAEEQQVRSVRMNDRIRKDLGIEGQDKLSKENLDKWFDEYYNPNQDLSKTGFKDVTDLMNSDAAARLSKGMKVSGRPDILNWLNKAWMVPAVGAAGVAVQEKKEGGKNMKAKQYKNKYEKKREELGNKYDSLRRSRGFIDMLFGNDEKHTRAMADLFDQARKNTEEEFSPITSGLKAARNSKRRQKAARLDLKKSNAEVGPTIENARKLKSQGAPDIFPTPNLGTQVASSINSFANDPKNKYKPKTLSQAKAEMRKMKPEQLKASGKANFTLGPLDAAAAASSGLVGGTIGLGGALLNTTIPGLGLTLGEGLGAYGGYDAIANRIPQTVKDYKNKKYGSAAENAIMGGLGLLGLGSNFKNFKLPKFTSSKKPSAPSNQLAPPPAEIQLLPEGGSISYATPVTPPPPPTVFNKSGLSKDAILSNPNIKNKDAISKLSNSEFEKTVLKPNGEVVEYEPAMNLNLEYDRNLGKLALKDRVPMTTQEYTDEFNSRLDMLNDIIERNNTSGTQYFVKGLDENGRLTFSGPTGESNFYVDINPGLWKGDVKDIANTDYFRSIPGLGMRSTTNSVFGDGRARKGSRAYESINEYLKKLDMGRVKAGFNSQTSSSKPLWENAIKSGKAYGFYADPNTVHGVMRNLIPPLLIGGAGAAMQEKKNGSKLLKYKNGSKSVSLAFSRGEKDPKGGLTQKGVDKYNRATGGNLKMAVTTPPSKLKPGSKAANRRKSFCARMSGVKGPMQKNGKPTRKALALRKWNC